MARAFRPSHDRREAVARQRVAAEPGDEQTERTATRNRARREDLPDVGQHAAARDSRRDAGLSASRQDEQTKYALAAPMA